MGYYSDLDILVREAHAMAAFVYECSAHLVDGVACTFWVPAWRDPSFPVVIA